MDALFEAFKNLIPTQTVAAKVTHVDKQARTIDAEPVNGNAEMFDVRLQAIEGGNGFVIFPKKDSIVLICLIDNNINSAFVALVSESEEIIFNGGQNGGLIINDKLTKEIEKLNAFVTAIQTGFTNWIPAPGDGGAALKTLMQTALSTQKTADLSKVTNDKFKH